MPQDGPPPDDFDLVCWGVAETKPSGGFHKSMKHNGIERHRVLPRYGGHNGAPSVHGCQPRPDNIEELIAFHRERVEREEAALRARHKRSEQTCAECCETTRDWRFLGQAGGILCLACVKKRLGREAAIHERFMRQ